jgi:hypothetical protein
MPPNSVIFYAATLTSKNILCKNMPLLHGIPGNEFQNSVGMRK